MNDPASKILRLSPSGNENPQGSSNFSDCNSKFDKESGSPWMQRTKLSIAKEQTEKAENGELSFVLTTLVT